MSSVAKLLMKKPRKDKGVNVPHITNMEPNNEHQIDVLYLPSDNGFKYLLVVVDVYDRKTYAAPLKNKNSQYVLNKLMSLYTSKQLPLPKRIDVDLGKEFQGVFRTKIKEKKIIIRAAQPGRHRQQAVVERKNQQIGNILFEKMLEDEIKTGKISKKWVKYLQPVLTEINKRAKHTQPPDVAVCSGDSCKLYDIGQKVYVILDEPRNYFGKKLTGRFRSADIRWHPEVRTIMDISITPGKPPLYFVNKPNSKDILNVGYTKNQLQPIK